MKVNELYKLKEKLCKELEGMSEGTITGSNLTMIDTLAHSIKNIGKIIAMETEEYSSASGMYSRDYGENPYGGDSYRGRGMMGRYSRGGSKQEMITSLEEMMDEATTSSERMAIQRCLEQLRK